MTLVPGMLVTASPCYGERTISGYFLSFDAQKVTDVCISSKEVYIVVAITFISHGLYLVRVMTSSGVLSSNDRFLQEVK